MDAIFGLGQMLMGNQQNQQEQANTQAQLQMLKQQFELDKQKFGWDQETANREWNMRLQQAGINQQSAKNYEASLTPAETRQSSIETASNILNPLYDKQMTETLNNTNAGLMQRGFFGQAPGAELTNKNIAEVENARNQAIANTANDIYQTSQDRYNQQKQFGINQFGQYGDVSQIDTSPVPVTPVAPDSGTNTGNSPADILNQFFQKRGIGFQFPSSNISAPTSNISVPTNNMAAPTNNIAAPKMTGTSGGMKPQINQVAPTSFGNTGTGISDSGNIQNPNTQKPTTTSGSQIAPTLANMQNQLKKKVVL